MKRFSSLVAFVCLFLLTVFYQNCSDIQSLDVDVNGLVQPGDLTPTPTPTASATPPLHLTPTPTVPPTPTSTPTPTATPIPGFALVKLSSMGGHTCSLGTNGQVYSWGANSYGELGNGSTTSPATAVAVQLPITPSVAAVSSGAVMSCALNSLGQIFCWGENGQGALGNGTSVDSFVPVPVTIPAGVNFRSVTSGSYFSCALSSTGQPYCWGNNSNNGYLGNGTNIDSNIPIPVHLPVGVVFTSMQSGSYTSCGLTQAGAAYCWGDNYMGQFGSGNSNASLVPVAVSLPAGVSLTSVAPGATHTCGLTLGGAAYCWGNNYYGQLGNNTNTTSYVPVRVLLPAGVSLVSIASGAGHTCGITASGASYCWGRNAWGEVGNGTNTDVKVPARTILPSGVALTSISAGALFTCGLTVDGAAYCWGDGSDHNLGNGSNTSSSTPVQVVFP